MRAIRSRQHLVVSVQIGLGVKGHNAHPRISADGEKAVFAIIVDDFPVRVTIRYIGIVEIRRCIMAVIGIALKRNNILKFAGRYIGCTRRLADHSDGSSPCSLIPIRIIIGQAGIIVILKVDGNCASRQSRIAKLNALMPVSG